MNEIQTENVKKWVESLLSGKYKQDTGRLRASGKDGSSYCCLGVACDIMDPEGWSERTSPWMGGKGPYWIHKCSTVEGHYPQLKWFEETFGLSESQMKYLARMNDAGYPFYRIAGQISAYADLESHQGEEK